jgi:hypothetical protein
MGELNRKRDATFFNFSPFRHLPSVFFTRPGKKVLFSLEKNVPVSIKLDSFGAIYKMISTLSSRVLIFDGAIGWF